MNLHSHSISSLQGVLTVPGDKSISHRAAILGGLAQGVTEVDNFLCSEDCLNTLRAMEQLGAKVDVLEERQGYGPVRFRITGVAMSPKAPERPIDCGNSGTGMRLLAGMLAACPFDSEMFGDASLSSRPMGRIMQPLEQMGARIEARGTKPGCAPLSIHGGRCTLFPTRFPWPAPRLKAPFYWRACLRTEPLPCASRPPPATIQNACSAISAFPAPWMDLPSEPAGRLSPSPMI